MVNNNDAENSGPPERPRVEPEIIPPDRTQTRSAWRPHSFGETGGTQRIYVTRLGPFGGALLMLALVVIAAVILLAFLGALLLWIPVVAFVVVVAALAGLWRRRRW